MYFYIAKNGKFFHNSVKTEAVKNAEIRITACFDEDYNLVIYSIKRVAGTELSKLLKAIRKMIDYATEIGVHNIINDTKKIPDCYLRKIGFETVDGCTLFKIS